MPEAETTSTDASTDRELVRLRVLASGSGGNCSVLVFGKGKSARLALIDCGLSPRKTSQLLARIGHSMHQVRDIVLTHMDSDHCYLGWGGKVPTGVTVHVARSHLKRAERLGFLYTRVSVFDDRERFRVQDAEVDPLMLSHDEEGVASFRFDFGGERMGFATDLGRVPGEFIEHFAGVEVMAIESNYCPRLQVHSHRPQFLKDRIMGGAGHLSNTECVAAVEAINPKHHVVLLHLSRQCNDPTIARQGHEDMPYELTITDQFTPTDWIRLTGFESGEALPNEQLTIFPRRLVKQ
ncbi:MAG: MBL fold metallo-hydrolase [Phycisphaerales bacterium JB043]